MDTSIVRRATSCDKNIINLINKLYNNDPDLNVLNLSRKILGDAHIRFLCSAISSNTNIRCLNLSHCNIGNSEYFTRFTRALSKNISIVEIDLQYNHISPIKMGLLADVLKQNINLRVLKLKEIHLSKEIQEQIIFAKEALEPFINENNNLFISIENKYTSLFINNRGISTIPDIIISLTYIKSLNLSYNRIRTLPNELQWYNIKELNISNNQLDKLPKSFIELSNLEILNLSSNNFTKIPILVSLLSNLKHLDISTNKIIDLSHIPLSSLAHHFQLESLLLYNNRFIKSCYKILSKDIIGNTNGSIVLQAIKKLKLSQQKNYSICLFVLGDNNQGKTSLIQSLQSLNKREKKKRTKKKHIKHTNDLFVESNCRLVYKSHTTNEKQYIDFKCFDWLSITPTYRIRLTSAAIYLIVVSLPLNISKLTQLKNYLDTIHTIIGYDVTIIIVLTFIDKYSKKELSQALLLLNNTVSISLIIPISNKNKKGIKDLSNILIKKAQTISYFGKNIPNSYSYFEENINALKLSKHYHPILNSEEIALILKQSGIDISKRDNVLRYFHDKGLLIYWNNEHISLSDYIILDFNILVNLYSKMVSYYGMKNETIIDIKELDTVWNEYGKDVINYTKIIFKRFELLSLTSSSLSTKAIFPYLIPIYKPVVVRALPKPSKRKVWRRIYKFTLYPCTFFSRLITAIYDLFPNCIIWQNGIIFSRVSTLDTMIPKELSLIEFDYLNNIVSIEIPSNWQNIFLNRITSIIEDIISPYKDIQYKIFIPCYHCIYKKKLYPNDSYNFSIVDIANLLENNISTISCLYNKNKPISVDITKLLPNTSQDILQYLVIKKENIQFGDEIGCGTYGRVYKALYNNYTVAVKVLNKIDETSNQARLFTEFRREVQFMAQLHNPYLIQLKGVASLPDFCVIQEYCPCGDLHKYLQIYKKNHNNTLLPFGYCLHIAYNIACGMEYLHSRNPPVLHRDLKSPNILILRTVEDIENHISNYHLNIGVLAKITDFGLSSQCNLPYSSRIVDNPLWLAPEIMEQKPYTKKVDIYSFGIIFYEILTCQIPFEEYNIKFLWKLEEMIRKENLRPTIPDFIDDSCKLLIQECWDSNPKNRPSFNKIITRLLTIMKEYNFVNEMSLNLTNDFDILESESDSETDTTDTDSDYRIPSVKRTQTEPLHIRRVSSLGVSVYPK